ncbi:hypothetical protein SAG0136_00500 [Streptococcus agalactiae LMG 14747]|uniref:Uncharacterized protein n=2 Tax=Streptococcus TaxID=1301 RepID=V6YYP3_STRAG|nr:hypothetical protein SAG0136_00500 [Streptococcus agalactiae LMG 14747]SNV44707.1 Uncharacterised protein [Streptococcus acidominimus]
MISFRDVVSAAIQIKRDCMVALYVSKKNPAYKETLAWYMAVKEPYQNVSTRSFDKMIK